MNKPQVVVYVIYAHYNEGHCHRNVNMDIGTEYWILDANTGSGY